MNNLSREYLAGVLDADGSFSISKRNTKRRPNCSYVPIIQLSWRASDTVKEFMEELVKAFGGSFTLYQSTNTLKSFANTEVHYKYCAANRAAVKLAQEVLPHLILKREQALNVTRLGDLNRSFTGPRPQETTEQMQSLYVKNRGLNHKNGWKNGR